MENKRNLIINKTLADEGIPLIAMYSNKHSESGLFIHDHGMCFEICYLKRGSQSYFIENEEFSVCGGEVFITFPHELHSTGRMPQGRGCLYWFHIDSGCANLLGLDKKNSALLIKSLEELKTRKIKIAEACAAKLVKAYRLIDSGSPIDLLAAKALLVTFIFELSEESQNIAETHKLSEATKKAVNYIEDHIKEPINLAALAEYINFSLSHFKYKFKKEMGMPPGEYIMQQKIYHSIPQLVSQSLTYIAYEYNFSSSQHYSKNFKAVTGTTPKEYRKILKESR